MKKVNRTIEIILVIFGLLASVLGIFSHFIYSAIFENPEILDAVQEEMVQEGFSFADINQSISLISSLSTYLTFIAIVSVIVGIIAIILLMGDKKPKAAGILLIIASVIVLVASVGTGFFAFVFYLIAGIVAVVRKAKPEDIEDPFIQQD